ncbi:MAG: dipeptidase [Candidatus Bathyarchaeia archaeon]|jgi:membrane dipeptidase
MKKLTSEETKRASELHKEAVIVDSLNASVMSDEYFRKLQKGGVTATNYTIAMMHNMSETVKRILDMQDMIATENNTVVLGTTAEDIVKAKREGKTAILLGFQNIQPLENDLRLLKLYHFLGVRIIQLSYHFRNAAADGGGERIDSGLSLFGISLIDEMNRLGMVVDLAHVGRQSVLEAVETSEDPVIASHSNPRALVDAFQNKTDEEIKAMAENGGVIGVTAFPRLLGKDPDKISLDNLLDCIDYVVELVGADHVGIGLDFAEGWAEYPPSRMSLMKIDGRIYIYPREIDTVTKFPNITVGLIGRGYSDAETKKILGENFLRVFEKVFGK